MRVAKLKSCSVILLVAFNMQSLVDVAREEAERRKRLEEQGIAAKVIDGNALGSGRRANITTSTELDAKPKESPARSDPGKGQASARSFRTALQKLDRAIQQNETRLASMRARLQAEKWVNPKNGKTSSRGLTKNPQSQLQDEIDDLRFTLRQLRDERLEVYEAGKKAGFMPGELEGRGIIP
jgi:predicted RNase H-like nuclease (RuvC/YqgF family)